MKEIGNRSRNYKDNHYDDDSIIKCTKLKLDKPLWRSTSPGGGTGNTVAGPSHKETQKVNPNNQENTSPPSHNHFNK